MKTIAPATLISGESPIYVDDCWEEAMRNEVKNERTIAVGNRTRVRMRVLSTPQSGVS